MQAEYDIAVIGGGINGAGIVRDAAGRGLKAVLFEQDDLASGTSSASTKLVHGGLRYLEHRAFSMVRKALAEREVLLTMAPHLVSQLDFILPHQRGMRPTWMIRLGLFLYDHMGGRKRLPASRGLDLHNAVEGAPLRADYKRGFEYADCRADDTRLVVLNAVDAARLGVDIHVRSVVSSVRRGGGGWHVQGVNQKGEAFCIKAKALVNATGPWAAHFLQDRVKAVSPRSLRLVKGSHIIVPRLFSHHGAYIFQNEDGRIVFAIPYAEDFTLIGTTDVDFSGDPASAKIDAEEIIYLCAAVNKYFRQNVAPSDVVWSFSGVRPLIGEEGAGEESATTLSRDYDLVLETEKGEAPLLTIFGGKLTTYRLLAEAALAKLSPFFPAMSGPWTANSHLPGGDFAPEEFDGLVAEFAARYDFLDGFDCRRLIGAYGRDAFLIFGEAKSVDDLGQSFGGGLYECEVRWMMEKEWAQTCDDILWRRSKLGLRLSARQQQDLSRWLEASVS